MAQNEKERDKKMQCELSTCSSNWIEANLTLETFLMKVVAMDSDIGSISRCNFLFTFHTSHSAKFKQKKGERRKIQ
jgi:hypothetical protein